MVPAFNSCYEMITNSVSILRNCYIIFAQPVHIMSISISSIFLMSVLVLGFASYPSISPLGNVAFAQEEIEIELTEEVGISVEGEVGVEETEEEAEEEEEVEAEEEEIEIEVEIEDGIAKIEVEFDGQELEFELEETDRDSIIDEIIERTGLTREQIEDVIKFEVEEEDQEERERPFGEKEVICHIPPGNPSKAHTITVGGHAVDRHLAHGDVIGPCDGQEFRSTERLAKFGEKQAEREARLAEKQAERESRLAEREAMLEEKESERESRLAEKRMEFEARLAEKETKALQRAEDLIQRLEQRIADLELRLQTLLNKVETGEYFGTVPKIDPVSHSYSISIDGIASSLFDESVTSDVSGEIFIENLVTTSKVSKFKVTGGEIFVGDNIYDVIFGKARISSSGPSGEKDSMVLILQAMDTEGNTNTIRLGIDFDSALEGDFGTEPIELEIIKNSKISGQWSLSASGQLSLL
ncbi:MAG: hypothetical protein NPMRTH1_80004 [Nitrosopumilales archaeon]|nr:MAG: hypothetical protein NPMRTH1_80004 [Nitrosopumilales archaeon]